MALNEKTLRAAKADPGKQVFVRDTKLKGFALRVTPAGVKSYIAEGRKIDGSKFRVTLGRADEITLKDARERAADELAAARAGEATLTERKREAKAAPTVADLAKAFMHDREKTAKPKTLQNYRQQLGRYILPVLGKAKVADVTRGDVAAMVADLPRITHNRVLALSSAMFRFAEHMDWRGQHTSPVYGIKRHREEDRDRVLRPDELARLAAALVDIEERHPAPVAAIRFATLTGLRIGEVLNVQRDHVDRETGRLLIPESKTGRRHHDLGAAALDLLDGLPNLGPWYFTVNGHRPLSYHGAQIVMAEAVELAGIDHATLHDLRRTFMTEAAASGISAHVLRDLLGHKTAVIADRYIRAVGDPVREAREAVGNAMADMMAGKGKVVPMKRRT